MSGPTAQVGQRLDCGVRTAKMIDEFAKRDWPDVLGSDQTQARQPLLIIKADGSVPFRHIVDVMALAKSHGIKHMAIAGDPKP